MSGAANDARHLTFHTVDELWSSGAPMTIPIKGEPFCLLQLDPKNAQVTLVTEYETPEPDVAKLRNIHFAAEVEGENDLAKLTVRVEGNVHGAYGLLASIADGLQIEKLPLAAAVAVGLSRHRNVLASRAGLTVEREIGLFGELVFLEYLVESLGSGPAVAAWQGPLSEEHDFTFDAVHVEVKTTSSERRRHVVHGLDQLVPLHDVPLSLVSIQLTRTSPERGRTLPQIIGQVRALAGGYQVQIDSRLENFAWSADDADLYTTFWALRSEPRAYAVRGAFPAMTPDAIRPVVPNFGLVSEVSYKVDLTDFEHDSLPDPIGGFVESKEK